MKKEDSFYWFLPEVISKKRMFNTANPKDTYKEISWSKYVKDFQTIHVDIGRRTGKTRFIIENYDDEKDLVIVTTWMMKNDYAYYMERPPKNIFTVHEISSGILKTRSQRGFRNIWIDEYHLILKAMENKDVEDFFNFYMNFHILDDTIIIKLGSV